MYKSNNFDARLGLIENISGTILNKLIASKNFVLMKDNELEVVIISGDSVENITKFIGGLGGKYENLGYGFGIVTLAIEKLPLLESNDKIQYIELPKNLYTTDAKSNKVACVQAARTLFGLEGQGVLVGFIDSGIDYTHPAFINSDGTSRIEYIYDLSEGGAVYNKEIINQALKAVDPFAVVSSHDLNGHGTHVAGIACGGGQIDSNYYGVAPKSSIIMVKCTRGKYALSTNIMRGLKFLIDKSKELNMPLAVNLSLSTNDGAHNGTSLLEGYISTVATLERVTISIAAGNEGEAAHHIGGELKDEKQVSVNIARDESSVIINLYKSLLPQIEIKLVSPTGATSGYIPIREGYREGNIGRDRYQIFSTGAKPFDISGEIIIALNTNSKFLSTGQWDISLKVTNKYTGIFDMWLPILEGLNMKTKFLKPTVLNTLGIPATVSNIIAVGSYNYLTNNISSFSGRGKDILYGIIRPDVVAPGENIVSVVPNGGIDVKSGTSMAAPHVTGIAALLMEWGIVRKNDPYFYGERLKYYLIIGAKRTRVDIVYPDPSWGYGEVCISNSLELLVEILGVNRSEKNNAMKLLSRKIENQEGYKEYMIDGLFIRIPKTFNYHNY